MEKNYKELTNLQKREVARKYMKTKKGYTLGATLNRLVFWGVLAFVCSFSFALIALTTDPSKGLKICLWILCVFMAVVGLVYLIWQHKIRMREYNRFLENSDTYENIRKNMTPHKKRKK